MIFYSGCDSALRPLRPLRLGSGTEGARHGVSNMYKKIKWVRASLTPTNTFFDFYYKVAPTALIGTRLDLLPIGRPSGTCVLYVASTPSFEPFTASARLSDHWDRRRRDESHLYIGQPQGIAHTNTKNILIPWSIEWRRTGRKSLQLGNDYSVYLGRFATANARGELPLRIQLLMVMNNH